MYITRTSISSRPLGSKLCTLFALATALAIGGGLSALGRSVLPSKLEPMVDTSQGVRSSPIAFVRGDAEIGQSFVVNSDHLAAVELLRLALPRRVFTLSQVKYTIDRLAWLYENRELIGGLEFYEEPKVLRFFFGKLRPTSDWQEKLVEKFKADFGDSL